MNKLFSSFLAVILSAFFVVSAYAEEVKTDAPMPHVIVLILCKSQPMPFENDVDAFNAKYTGNQNRVWIFEHSKMQCTRQAVDVYDQAEAQGAEAQPFNIQRCQRSGIMMGSQWDAGHPSSNYRFWRVACPVPIRLSKDPRSRIVDWKIPECGSRDTVECLVDSEI